MTTFSLDFRRIPGRLHSQSALEDPAYIAGQRVVRQRWGEGLLSFIQFSIGQAPFQVSNRHSSLVLGVFEILAELGPIGYALVCDHMV